MAIPPVRASPPRRPAGAVPQAAACGGHPCLPTFFAERQEQRLAHRQGRGTAPGRHLWGQEACENGCQAGQAGQCWARQVGPNKPWTMSRRCSGPDSALPPAGQSFTEVAGEAQGAKAPPAIGPSAPRCHLPLGSLLAQGEKPPGLGDVALAVSCKAGKAALRRMSQAAQGREHRFKGRPLSPPPLCHHSRLLPADSALGRASNAPPHRKQPQQGGATGQARQAGRRKQPQPWATPRIREGRRFSAQAKSILALPSRPGRGRGGRTVRKQPRGPSPLQQSPPGEPLSCGIRAQHGPELPSPSVQAASQPGQDNWALPERPPPPKGEALGWVGPSMQVGGGQESQCGAFPQDPSQLRAPQGTPGQRGGAVPLVSCSHSPTGQLANRAMAGNGTGCPPLPALQ